MSKLKPVKNIGFVSFAAGDLGWGLALRRIQKQSLKSGFFNKVKMYKESDLIGIVSPQDYDFMKSNRRGYGFWLWKPIIVLDFLDKNQTIDYIVYLDSGCDINYSQEAKIRFEQYLSILENFKCICFEMELIEEAWTKHEIIEALKVPNKILSSPQLLGGVFIMERNFAMTFCRKWLTTMKLSNYSLLDNSFNHKIQSREFKEPRHDQSIFSVLMKSENPVSILSSVKEVYFHPDWNRGNGSPFWTSRNKSMIPYVKQDTVSRGLRLIERGLIKIYFFLRRTNTR
jgi:hypothetical protein